MKALIPILIAALCASCANRQVAKFESTQEMNDTLHITSAAVQDSFVISVATPLNYNPRKKYPVVYLLDGSFYFNIMKETFRFYELAGMVPPVILVGVGYSSLEAADANRERDDTYPEAKKEYEMSRSGGGDKFLSFLTNELGPRIDSIYPVDKNARVLAGHSLGGYFVAHALRREMEGKSTGFTGFVAGSPSLHYNDHYVVKELEKLTPVNSKELKLYVTYGGLEDNEEDDVPGFIPSRQEQANLTALFAKMPANKIEFKTDSFTNLGHMETPIPSFVKGVGWVLQR